MNEDAIVAWVLREIATVLDHVNTYGGYDSNEMPIEPNVDSVMDDFSRRLVKRADELSKATS